ncbi:MAG: family 16 glycosylhydrolase [Cyclobacteriaceae bacterium]|nr:family 16 glycosylhydrolase [Cyclobacteriaceae bacterium]
MRLSYGVIVLLTVLISCKEDESETTQINGLWLDDFNISEGNSNSTKNLLVRVEGSVAETTTIAYMVKEGKAKFGIDLLPGSGSVTLEPGQSNFQIPVQLIGDEHLEITEAFTVELTVNGNTFTIQPAIVDDDSVEAILSDEDGFYTSAEHPSMQLVWQDEFNGNSLNAEYWSYELGNGCSIGICGWGNNELQTYTNNEANVKVENGNLIITAINNLGSYTSARIKTQNKIKPQFGRIDVRARLPKGQGIWPAIWMLGENITSINWPGCGEIDIMELVGHEPAKSHGTVHFDQGGYKSSTGSTTLSSGDFSEAYHVFSLVWDKNSITWYVDNQAFKSFSHQESEFNLPFFFLMNVAVGGNWPGSPNASTVFPQSMVVDYIRVFQ